ncbi:TolC family protein [Burkholderia contaminans]|nr:TolC family protein [Burkholderia contaminans]MBH9672199.1 TolC family protein [Burkholderia contaminans]MBH9679659.1 TolC family protein [Burkholderia contaminans]MBH9709706.1 TolC family protein [Burkholderia contaminans]MBH9723945.1 TolC family protein [Burkholderia contaminans]
MSGFRMIGTCVDAHESRVAFRVAASAVLIVLSMWQSAGAAHAANPVSSRVAMASASTAAHAATSAGSDGLTDASVPTYDDSASATPGGATMTERELRRMLYAAAEAAVDVSPQVRRLYAEYQAAQSDVDQAKGARWPQLQLNGQTRNAQFGSNAGSAYDPGNSLGVNLTTTLFDWGRTEKTIGSRRELASAGQERYVAQMEDSAYQVTATLVELAKQRNIAELSQRFVDRMTRLVRMLDEIVAVDRGRGSELTQAKARLLQAEASRDAALAKCRTVELNLRKLVGERPVPMPMDPHWPLHPGNLDRLMSALDENPRLRQARAEAGAAELNRDAVRAASRPQLNWVVSTNTGHDTVGRRMPWQTMLTLTWNAFTGGAATAATDAATFRASASWRQVEQMRLDLEYQVRSAEQDAYAFGERADQYRDLSVESARVRSAFFDQWYHLGRRSLLDVLIAENDDYNNRVNEVAYRFDGYAATLRGYASAGMLVQWLREG